MYKHICTHIQTIANRLNKIKHTGMNGKQWTSNCKKPNGHLWTFMESMNINAHQVWIYENLCTSMSIYINLCKSINYSEPHNDEWYRRHITFRPRWLDFVGTSYWRSICRSTVWITHESLRRRLICSIRSSASYSIVISCRESRFFHAKQRFKRRYPRSEQSDEDVVIQKTRSAPKYDRQ